MFIITCVSGEIKIKNPANRRGDYLPHFDDFSSDFLWSSLPCISEQFLHLHFFSLFDILFFLCLIVISCPDKMYFIALQSFQQCVSFPNFISKKVFVIFYYYDKIVLRVGV